jgi:hypothetical protein
MTSLVTRDLDITKPYAVQVAGHVGPDHDPVGVVKVHTEILGNVFPVKSIYKGIAVVTLRMQNTCHLSIDRIFPGRGLDRILQK